MGNPSSFETSITDKTVAERTGRSWEEWFTILDKWGAQEKGHKLTAKFLAEEWKVSPWWSQTITVRYEQMRGKRRLGQRSDGKFAVSVTRSIKTTNEKAWDALVDPALLSIWFTKNAESDLRVGGSYSNADGDRGKFLAIEPYRRLKFTWENPDHCPGTIVEFAFSEISPDRVRVVLEHQRIEDQTGYEKMKADWSQAMGSLKSFLETGKPVSF